MATQTSTRPESNQTLEKKIQRVRELYATGPEMGKTALATLIRDLKSTSAREPETRMSSAGRIGSRQGKVSELLVIAPFAPGGAERLRALLDLRDGDFSDTDRVGTVHDMRFVFLDNDTKLLFATAYDGDWDPYIDDFAAKIPADMERPLLGLGRLARNSQPGSEELHRQAPNPGSRLVRRPSGSHGAGHHPAKARR